MPIPPKTARHGSRLLSAVDSTTRAPKRFCDRAVILLAICNWPKSVRMSIRRVRNPARQTKSHQAMWRARASTGLVLASIGRRNRPLGWMHSPRRKNPLEQPKAIGVTDVVPLHHQVYPRLRDRLSLRDRPNRSAVRAEARPERTGRNV